MAFRPCIDLRNGKVVQIVGGTLSDNEGPVTNFESADSAADFAAMYRRDGLRGGHVIALGPGNEETAISALKAYPGGLQYGGGVQPDNAAGFLDAGASQVIVTSYLFPDGELSLDRVREMQNRVGRDRLVVDLSCRRSADGTYRVATNRWQTITASVIDRTLFERLEAYCAEFLIHAADVEGKVSGIDEELVGQLAKAIDVPATYAGGARRLEDIRRVEELSDGKLDLTIGSALDIFGGSGVRYADAAQLGRRVAP